MLYEVGKKNATNFDKSQIFSLEESLQKNIESMKIIQKEKVNINDYIFQFISQYFKEISDEYIKFSLTNDALANLILSLTYDKIQDNSIAFSKLIPNSFIHKIDILCNNDAPSEKFKEKAQKYQNNIKSFREYFRKNANISVSAVYFNKIVEYINKSFEEFKEEVKRILEKFANFLNKSEKLEILLKNLKVFFFFKKNYKIF